MGAVGYNRFDELKDADGLITKEQFVAAVASSSEAASDPDAPSDGGIAEVVLGKEPPTAPPGGPTPPGDATYAEETDKKSAALHAKVQSMWAAIRKDEKKRVERLRCWDFIMADPEMAGLIGDGDDTKGRGVLLKMKEARALDIDGEASLD